MCSNGRESKLEGGWHRNVPCNLPRRQIAGKLPCNCRELTPRREWQSDALTHAQDIKFNKVIPNSE